VFLFSPSIQSSSRYRSIADPVAPNVSKTRRWRSPPGLTP
jgi:hypothetical protein